MFPLNHSYNNLAMIPRPKFETMKKQGLFRKQLGIQGRSQKKLMTEAMSMEDL